MSSFDDWWCEQETLEDPPTERDAYTAGLLRAAEIADNMAMRATEYADNIVAGKHPMQIPDYTERNGYRRVAAAIRKEIRGEI